MKRAAALLLLAAVAAGCTTIYVVGGSGSIDSATDQRIGRRIDADVTKEARKDSVPRTTNLTGDSP